MSLDKEMPLTNLAVSGKDALQQLGLSVRKKNSCAQINLGTFTRTATVTLFRSDKKSLKLLLLDTF